MDALTELSNNFGSLTAYLLQQPLPRSDGSCVESGPKTLLDFLRTTLESQRPCSQERVTYSKLFEATQALNLLDDLLKELFACAKGETKNSAPALPALEVPCKLDLGDQSGEPAEPNRTVDVDRCRVRIENEECSEPVLHAAKRQLIKIVVEGRNISQEETATAAEPVNLQALVESLIRTVAATSSGQITDDEVREAIVKITQQIERLIDRLPVKGHTPPVHCENKEVKSGDDEWTTMMQLLLSGREDSSLFTDGTTDAETDPAILIQNYRTALVQLRSQLGALLESRRKGQFGSEQQIGSDLLKRTQDRTTQDASALGSAEELARLIVQSAPGIPLAHAALSATAVAYVAALLYPASFGKNKDNRLTRKLRKATTRNKNARQRSGDGDSDSDQSAIDIGLAILLSARHGRR